MADPDAPVRRSHESSSGFFFTRSQTWGLAALLATATIGLGTVTYFAISRAHSLDHTTEQLHDLERKVEALETKQKFLERRQVQLQTHLENR